MYKVKSFTTEIKIFETRKELETLDNLVNDFVARTKVKLLSAADTCTTDDSGATIGIIRTIAYQQD